MNKKNLLNELNKASFNVNKRFKKPNHFPESESVLNTMQSLIEQAKYEDALDVINGHRQNKSNAIERYPKLLIAEGIALIALNRTQQALTTLHNACVTYEKRLKDDSKNESWRRNLSAVKSNMSACYILEKNYQASERSALISREWHCNWHGPHINLFTTYLRMNDTKSLDKSIKEMASSWPEWNTDVLMMSHLHGDKDLISDTDLVGIVDRLNSLGYVSDQV